MKNATIVFECITNLIEKFNITNYTKQDRHRCGQCYLCEDAWITTNVPVLKVLGQQYCRFAL